MSAGLADFLGNDLRLRHLILMKAKAVKSYRRCVRSEIFFRLSLSDALLQMGHQFSYLTLRAQEGRF
jgi:hypothetical protein